MSKKAYLIFGISKGLGKALAQQLPTKTDLVFGISRSQPAYLASYPNIHWIATDLSNPHVSSQTVQQAIGNQKIDYLIYNVGIWENQAFTNDYNFEEDTAEEINTIVNTNITSCILHIQSALNNLKQSENAKIILIGSTWGLENHSGQEVTFSATKFALRGIVHALRESLRKDRIGISILNLGYLASQYDNGEDRETVLKQTDGELIPLHDVILAVKFITATSNATCVKEIHMPAMLDKNL